MGRYGYGAIAYHFLIDPEGRIYYSRDLSYKGAHSYPNTGKMGVAFLRSFDTKEPNHKEREGLKSLTSVLEQEGVLTLGHNEDRITVLQRLFSNISIPPEIVEALRVPRSMEEFIAARASLLRCNLSPEFLALAGPIKTCPGIYAYLGGLFQ